MRLRNIVLVIMAIAGFSTFFNWGSDAVDASQSDEAKAPQAMPVETTLVSSTRIQLWKPFSGNVVAVDEAEIRPQVDGRIVEIHFQDGQYVNKNDLLLIIDPRPYQAALDQAEATLRNAKTQALLAEKEYKRATELIRTKAISQSLLDTRASNRESASAAVKGAKALVESARINLDYANVKSPISGKISRAEITEGNLVKAGPSAPLLTSIVSDGTVYVDFEVDENTYLRSVHSAKQQSSENIPVRLKLDGINQEMQGHIHSFDNKIDSASGTIRARAIFNNDEKLLLPGMSVSILMGSANGEEHILITERAIGTDQNRKFVYVIDENNHATYREVTLGDSVNGKRVILSGLNEGEAVIREGLVKIRPNMPVQPKILTEPSDGSADKQTTQ